MKKLALKIAVFVAFVVCAQLSYAAVGPRVLMLIPNQATSDAYPIAGSNPDKVAQHLITTFGASITYGRGWHVTPGTMLGYNLIIVMGGVNTGDLGTKARDIAVPVICCENGSFGNMNMATGAGTGPSATQITILNAASPLAAGKTGDVTTELVAHSMTYAQTFGGGVDKVACVKGSPNNICIFSYDTGAAMVSGVAPARRVGFYMADSSITDVSPDSWLMLDAAVTWAATTVQPPVKKILFVGGPGTLGGGNINNCDSNLNVRLNGLGAKVTYMAEGNVNSGSANGFDAIVVSESIGGGNTNNFRASNVAMMMMEPNGRYVDLGFTGGNWQVDAGDAIGFSVLNINPAQASNYLAAGLTGAVTVSTSNQSGAWGSGTSMGTGAMKIASMPAPNDTKYGIFAYDMGSPMMGGFIAPARRVGFFSRQDAPERMTLEGWRLFDAAYGYITGADIANFTPTPMWTKYPYQSYPNYAIPNRNLMAHFTMDQFVAGSTGVKSTTTVDEANPTVPYPITNANSLLVTTGPTGLGKAVRRMNGNYNGQLNWPAAVMDDWTITFWIRTVANGQNATDGAFWGNSILNADRGGTGWDDWGVYLRGGRIAVGMDTFGLKGSPRNTIKTADCQFPINDGQWHWVLIRRDSTTGACEIAIDDGQPTDKWPAGNWKQTILYPGTQWGGTQPGDNTTERLLENAPDVIIDDFYEYNRKLNDGEAYNIWTKAKGNFASPDFVHHFAFDEVSAGNALPLYSPPGIRNDLDPTADLGLLGLTTATMVIGDPTKMTVVTDAKIGGKAIKFAGTQLTGVIFSNTNWTVGFWIKTAEVAQGNSSDFYDSWWLYGHDVGGQQRDYDLGLQTIANTGGRNAGLVAGIDNLDGTGVTLRSGVINNNSWHHVAWGRDAVNGDSRLYVDGALVSKIPNLFLNQGAQDAMTNSQIMDNRFQNTIIDDYLIYNRMLTDDEVLGMAQANTTNAIKKQQWSVFE